MQLIHEPNDADPTMTFTLRIGQREWLLADLSPADNALWRRAQQSGKVSSCLRVLQVLAKRIERAQQALDPAPLPPPISPLTAQEATCLLNTIFNQAGTSSLLSLPRPPYIPPPVIDALESNLNSLPDRTQRALRLLLRTGSFADMAGMLGQVANISIPITRSRASQIASQGLRMLRHPARQQVRDAALQAP